MVDPRATVDTNRPQSPIRTFGWIAAGILVVQVGAYGFMRLLIGDAATRGQFGDAFGVTNSLFSGLAFAGLICTILLQQRQIDVQRAEAADTRAEAAAALLGQQRSTHLAALTFLIEHYGQRLDMMRDIHADGPKGAALKRTREDLANRRGELEQILKDIHADVVENLGGRACTVTS